MKSILLIVLLALTAGCTYAQTAPPLAKPYLHRAPALSSWIITYTYKTDAPKPGETSPKPTPVAIDRIVSVTVIKNGKTYNEVTLWTSGRRDEKWNLDGIQLSTSADGRSIVPIPPPTEEVPQPDYSDYSRHDFEGFEWLAADHYKGVEERQGTPAFHFASGTKQQAYLSVENHLPLLLDDGEIERTYTYTKPDAAALVPPEKFVKVLRDYKAGMAALRFHASPP